MRGNPFFVQERPGQYGKVFKMLKYRTMTNARDQKGNLLPDKDRLTKFGRFLRKTSIDELPELWNVFIGDMSIVGPRPLSPKYLSYHTVYEKQRYTVKPGITGWAQINGRSGLDWEERFWYDVEYVNNLSLAFDIKIFFRTINKVLKRTDAVERADISLLNFNDYRQKQLYDDYVNKEIGSEFWTPYGQEGDNFVEQFHNSNLTFSGRTALDLIIKDLIKTKGITKVLLPDYLCPSILSPLKINNINVDFYSVILTASGRFDVDLSSIKDTHKTAFFILDYFFFDENYYKKMFDYARLNNMPIIHDITHSLLSDNLTIQGDDYYFASLRKWLSVPDGAIVGKEDGLLSTKTYKVNRQFLQTKLNAMELKRKYIVLGKGEKNQFLELFQKAESYFDRDFQKRDISKESLFTINHTSFLGIKKQRKENVQALVTELAGLDLELIYEKDSTPLFVPIILKDKMQRDALQQYMIDRDIYLPIHWQKLDNQENTIYNRILSLVIDQRYTTDDMVKIADAIKEFLRVTNA